MTIRRENLFINIIVTVQCNDNETELFGSNRQVLLDYSIVL